MFSKKEIIKLSKKYNFSPKKRWGQHFLISKRETKAILKEANLKKRDIVLEVGAGMGNLTYFLAKKCKKVIAVERDERLVKISKKILKDQKNVKIIKADILKFNAKKYNLQKFKYKVVANLPYYLSSRFLRTFLEKFPPKEMILLLQKELAEKILAKDKKESILSLSVKFFASCKMTKVVKKDKFWPKPTVDSALIKLKVKKNLPKIKKEVFFKILKAGFLPKRKKLTSNLSKNLKIKKEILEKIFKKLKIKNLERAENLSLNQWIKLSKEIQNFK